jgi:soluble cytochrome b562
MVIDYSGLVAEMRTLCSDTKSWVGNDTIAEELALKLDTAADALEAVQKERDALRESCDNLRDYRHEQYEVLAGDFTRLKAENERYKEALDGLKNGRASAIATYLGGYHEPRDINIFRHGMDTVFNIIDAALAPLDATKEK